MKRAQSYYIKERHNPQLGVYFIACGQMTKRAAKESEASLYGYNIMRPLPTKEAYEIELELLRAKGERVQ